jgi:hypothetical protein
MQNIINKLQEIIQTHYGYTSELELRPMRSYQQLHREIYSKIDRILSIPVLEPKSRQPIAFFKIFDVEDENTEVHERLNDLVHLTLQSYVDLIDQLDVSESLINYLQTELHPQNIIRLHDRLRLKNPTLPIQRISSHTVSDVSLRNSELLILSPSLLALDRLAYAIHETSKNPFFIRSDHMPESFLTSLNDLTGIHETTLYIPRLQKLSPAQQKTLETYLLLTKDQPSSLLIICGTRSSLSKMVAEEDISPRLLELLHFFHVLSQSHDEAPVKFETLSQCALSILGLKREGAPGYSSLVSQKTKSYNIIPSLNDLYPTVH